VALVERGVALRCCFEICDDVLTIALLQHRSDKSLFR
jgi:hypothetical protein